MSFSLYSIIVAVVLCMNGLAILSETRFLSKFGLSTPQTMHELQQHRSQRQDGDGRFEPAFGGLSPFEEAEQRREGGTTQSATRAEIAKFLSSVRMLMRGPLIVTNIVLILLAVILG